MPAMVIAMYLDQLPPPRIGGPGFFATAVELADGDAEALAVAEPDAVGPGETTFVGGGDGGVVCCASAGAANATPNATRAAQTTIRSELIGAQC